MRRRLGITQAGVVRHPGVTQGRVSAIEHAYRAVTSVPGRAGGMTLTLTAAAGVVIARRDPGGLVTMPVKPYVAIPAALRRRCGTRAGRPDRAGRVPRRGHAGRVLDRGRGPGAAGTCPFPHRDGGRS